MFRVRYLDENYFDNLKFKNLLEFVHYFVKFIIETEKEAVESDKTFRIVRGSDTSDDW